RMRRMVVDFNRRMAEERRRGEAKVRRAEEEKRRVEEKLQSVLSKVYRVADVLRTRLNGEGHDEVAERADGGETAGQGLRRLDLENSLLREQLLDRARIQELVRQMHLAPPTPPIALEDDLAGRSLLSSHSYLRDAGYSSGVVLGSEEGGSTKPRASMDS